VIGSAEFHDLIDPSLLALGAPPYADLNNHRSVNRSHGNTGAITFGLPSYALTIKACVA